MTNSDLIAVGQQSQLDDAGSGNQEKLDTIVKALGHLPQTEIDKLGFDLNDPIIDGTERAELLKLAWRERQELLKVALSSMIKPAEHMAEIVKTLVDVSSSVAEVSSSLQELEALLGDIDNARDFHTIGGWPALTNILEKKSHIEHRMYAAKNLRNVLEK